MFTSSLLTHTKSPHILCLGAHCDDIEIGCGGTLLKLIEKHERLSITWVVFASDERRKSEAEQGASVFAGEAEQLYVRIFEFKDGYFPMEAKSLKDTFEHIKASIPEPDLIFTHYRHDLHQDHRQVCELTWNTFRDHSILEYEIPKWDGDLGQPNMYIALSKDQATRKIDKLQQVYNSQQSKSWFTDDLFWSLMRIRGMECRSEQTVAEAFYARKWLIG